MKKCAHCKLEKELESFGKNKYKKDGLQTNCKDCAKSIFQEYYKNNKDKHRETVKRKKHNQQLKEKECDVCCEIKPIDHFGKRGRNKSCKACQRIKERKWDQDGIKKRREFIQSFKDKCIVCDEDDHCALDFHHLRDKKINLGNAADRHKSKQVIIDEIEKCILLCANCHRKYHQQRFCLIIDKSA